MGQQAATAPVEHKAERADFGRCFYCKRTMKDPKRRAKLSATRDHVFPKCMGGQKTVKCCRHCNQLKGDMLPHRWRAAMRSFPMWWKLFHTNQQLMAAMAEVGI